MRGIKIVSHLGTGKALFKDIRFQEKMSFQNRIEELQAEKINLRDTDYSRLR